MSVWQTQSVAPRCGQGVEADEGLGGYVEPW